MEKKTGRPSTYTHETAKEICRMIENGMTLVAICQLPDMPDISTVYDWQDSHTEFSESYARARQRQADTFASMVMTEAFNSHDAQIGRLRIDALKWTASKLAPKKYGDKVEVEQTGNANFKISFAVPDRDTKDSLKELSAPVARLANAEPIEAEIVESE
jgi:hypothetical protein